MSNSYFLSFDWTLSGTTTLDQSAIGSDKMVLRIPQSSSITGASLSDDLVSHLGHSLGESYLSAAMQSVYSTVPADWYLPASVVVFKKVIRNHEFRIGGPRGVMIKSMNCGIVVSEFVLQSR